MPQKRRHTSDMVEMLEVMGRMKQRLDVALHNIREARAMVSSGKRQETMAERKTTLNACLKIAEDSIAKILNN